LALRTSMTTVPTFCFVIPCFNKEGNVAATVGSVREGMGGRDDYEIILVNDTSPDHTLERMQDGGGRVPHPHS
jgi:glycosyltransferase involved in cell wall biosynthesis